MFSVNQIVRGEVCGTFVILALFVRNGEHFAQLKEVHPVTFDRPQRGELCLPVSKLRPVN